jgi:hypothetical protein
MARPSRYSPEVRERAVRTVFECERPVGPREQRPFGRLFCTPYWTTFELPAIDMKAASVGILGQIVGRPQVRSLRESRGGSASSGSATSSAPPRLPHQRARPR